MIRDVDELQVLYVLYVINVLPAARNAGRQKLHQQETFIRFLSTVPTSERLAKCIIDVLDQVEDWKPAEMAKAFEGLESFALNLLDFPWKKEFRTILTYSGFYKTRLEPYICNPDGLLRSLGYERTADHKLKITTGLPDRRTLERVAFSYFLAAIECRTIDSVCSNVNQSALAVYRYRRHCACDVDGCIEGLQSLADTSGKERVDVTAVDSEKRNVQRATRDDIIRAESIYRGDVKLPPVLSDWTSSYGFPATYFMQLPTGDDTSYTARVPPTKQTNAAFNTPRILDTSDCGTSDVVPSPTPWRLPVEPVVTDPSSSRLTNERWHFDGAQTRSGAAPATDVDQLAALLQEVDPDRLKDSETRRRIMSRLAEHELLPSNNGGRRPRTEPLTRVASEPRRHTEPMTVGRRERVASDIDDAAEWHSPYYYCSSCGKLSATGGHCTKCLKSSMI